MQGFRLGVFLIRKNINFLRLPMQGTLGALVYVHAMPIIILGKWGFKPVVVRGCI